MNQLNENLAVIRRQKKIYEKQLKNLEKKIRILSEEETKILKELGVKI